MVNISIWNNDELYNLYKAQLQNYGKTSIPKHHKKQLGSKAIKELKKFGEVK